MQRSSTTSATHAIAYYRRSTSHSQKHSLQAQQNYVEDFCTKEGIIIVASFEETFTGKEMNRPEFNKALEMARKQKIPIIIKSLSRLGRDAAGVIGLLNTEKIIVADRGLECDRLTLNILAVIDQNERERISERTKEGLKAAKKKGIKLGNPNPQASLAKGQVIIQEGADGFAERNRRLILPMHEAGHTLQQIADDLNIWGVKTRRGGKWYPTTVKNLVERLKKEE